MGILKIMTKPDADEMYLENAIHYIIYGHSIVSGGFNICPECALEQMQIVKNYFGKTQGNQLVHFVISFNRNVWNIAYAEKLARKIAKYYADCYQILYAVHAEPRVNRRGEVVNLLHVHMMMNSVSFVDGKHYADSRKESKKYGGSAHTGKLYLQAETAFTRGISTASCGCLCGGSWRIVLFGGFFHRGTCSVRIHCKESGPLAGIPSSAC